MVKLVNFDFFFFYVKFANILYTLNGKEKNISYKCNFFICKAIFNLIYFIIKTNPCDEDYILLKSLIRIFFLELIIV